MCSLTGSNLRVKQFDEESLAENEGLNGNCEYTFFSAGEYEVNVKALFCGPSYVGCGHKVCAVLPLRQYRFKSFNI